jgi:hypothetical protein
MKSKVGIILLGVLIFLLGGVAGAVSRYLYVRHFGPAPIFSKNPNDIIDGIARNLKMDLKQKESLRVIFDQAGQKYQELYKEFGPKYDVLNKQYGPLYEELHKQYRPRRRAIREESEAQIKKILNPSQKARYEKFLKEAKSAQKSLRQTPPSY